MQNLTLKLPQATSEIRVGSNLSKSLQSIKPAPLILIDEHVLCQHHDIFGAFQCIPVPAGEEYKTMETVERLYRELVKLEADRSTLLIGVGGGLATDVAGFVASTYLRGLSFGIVSTTLLGQVDASIGGKNGVNLDGYKNMIGNIRQPDFVWCDLDLLSTLARKEYISGLAEVIKYGAIMDVDFLEYLERHMPELLAMDPDILEEVVSRSVLCKIDIVSKDEKEGGLRRILNFGHTIGHAMERSQKLLHGYAISVGMVMAAGLSRRMGLLGSEEESRIRTLLLHAGLPVELHLDADTIFHNLRKDKKKSGEVINFVLLEGLGKAVVRPIPLPELEKLLHDLC